MRYFPRLTSPRIDHYLLQSLDQAKGAVDYKQVMERFRLSKKEKIRAAANQRPVHYVVFDILQHNGRDLRNLPLIKRKSILESVLKPNLYVSTIPVVENHGIDLYKEISAKTMKGIIGKRKDSLYVSGYSQDWKKVVRISKKKPLSLDTAKNVLSKRKTSVSFIWSDTYNDSKNDNGDETEDGCH